MELLADVRSVCTAAGDRVPGPRSHALLAPVEFPWKSAVDHIEEVGSHDSYSLSLDLCRQGIVCGPSSGFNLQGLYNLIEKRKAAGNLSELANPNGEIHCVFLCCDLPYQYINEYFDKLGDKYFPEIHNEALTKVDLYRYDDRWEKEAPVILRQYFDIDGALAGSLTPITSKVVPKPSVSVIDLRQPLDFQDFHLPGSVNLPFVNEETVSPFSDPQVLEDLWKKLEATFKTPSQEIKSLIEGKQILLLCYDGDSARVATSVLNAKGYDSSNLKGGFKALRRLRAESDEALRTGGGQTVDGIAVTLSNPIAQAV